MTPTPAELERNIRRYVAFASLGVTPFMLPVLVLFWQQNGLDLFDVFLLQAIFAVAIVLLEVPTGMVADHLGKRTSLVWGTSCSLAGMITYALGHDFITFLAGELLLALGVSLISGAGSALLYDTLAALGRAGDYERLEGRARGLQMACFAVSNLLGGLVGTHSYRATVWLSAIGPLLGLLLALALREARTPVATRPWREHLDGYRRLLLHSVRFVHRHRLVRWQILFLGSLLGTNMWLLWLYQPYMQWSGLPVWAFGVAFTIFNLFAALVSQWPHHVDRACGRIGTIILLVVLQLLPLPLLASWVAPASFLFILGHQAVRALAVPILNARILRYTYADKRATVLSIASMSIRLFYAATAPVIGLVARQTSLAHTLWVQLAAMVVLFGVLLIVYLRIPARYFAVKESVRARQ